MDGALIIDKPAGITSHDVVNRLRRLSGLRRIGHLGTLDPLATGVLPLVIGKATRLAQFLSGGEKEYDAWVRFGSASDTYDRQGSPCPPSAEPSFTQSDLERALAPFRGTILQTPPPVSAKKIAGVPAYKLARKKLPVDLKPVEVTISVLDLVEFTPPRARLRMRCTAGAYVRSVAHELGLALGCGAVLDELRRTQSGPFTLDQAHTLPDLAALAASGHLDQALIPAARLLPEFPSQRVDSLTAGQIRQGRDFRVSPFHAAPDAPFVKAVTDDGQLLAIGELHLPHLYHPVLVL